MSKASALSSLCSIEVIHHEKCSARHTRRRTSDEYRASAEPSPCSYQAPSASARTRTSATARFSPFAPFPLVHEGDQRRFRLDPRERHVLRLEEQRPPALDARGDQVLDNLLLSVDRDRAAAGERRKVDPVPLAGELQLDSLVDQALAAQAVADAHLLEQVHGALLENAGSDPALDVLAAARLEDDRVDSAEVQEVRQHKAGRPGADDPDLRTHQASSSLMTSWKTENAPFAAGTPQ